MGKGELLRSTWGAALQDGDCLVARSTVEIEPEQFLILFRPGTTSVRSCLVTFFVPEPENKHSLCP